MIIPPDRGTASNVAIKRGRARKQCIQSQKPPIRVSIESFSRDGHVRKSSLDMGFDDSFDKIKKLMRASESRDRSCRWRRQIEAASL